MYIRNGLIRRDDSMNSLVQAGYQWIAYLFTDIVAAATGRLWVAFWHNIQGYLM